MVRIWQFYYNETGVGYLPEAGGIMEQSALMMEALGIMTAFYQRFKKEFMDK